MAGGRTKDTDTPDGFWLWWNMIDFDGEGRSFASSEQTLVDSWCCVAGICDSGGDDRGGGGGGGGEVRQNRWREMEKGMEWFGERDDEDDNEARRYEKKRPSYEDIDSYRPISLPTPRSRGTKRNIRPRLNLRGGAGSRRLGDDERVPKVIWFLAGGVGRAPTGKGLREWKEKARKKGEGGTKERGGFWGKLGLGTVKKGKKQKQKTEEERKGNAEAAEGAEGAPDSVQAADGEVAGGDGQGDVGDVAPGGSGGEAGAASEAGESAQMGKENAQRGAASNSSGRGSGSRNGSGSSGSGSGSGDPGRAE